MAGITIERLTIAGFRAYLREQEIALRRDGTPKSLAVFAPNAKGKSSLVDALEFFFSQDGTLERLGQRRSGRQAGREALEHVRAGEEGIVPVVGVVFHSDEGPFCGRRSATAYDEPKPDAAERVRRARKVDFIIRGYQLRHFVDRQEPSERYKEVPHGSAFRPSSISRTTCAPYAEMSKKNARQRSSHNGTPTRSQRRDERRNNGMGRAGGRCLGDRAAPQIARHGPITRRSRRSRRRLSDGQRAKGSRRGEHWPRRSASGSLCNPRCLREEPIIGR